MAARPPVRDERAVAAYVERFGDSLTDAGMPRLASRVFARLLADDDGRMTAAELTEALEVSPAAISGAVGYLTQTYLIGKERERGSRRDVYVVQSDAWHGAMLSRDRVLAKIETSLRSGVPAVGGTSERGGPAAPALGRVPRLPLRADGRHRAGVGEPQGRDHPGLARPTTDARATRRERHVRPPSGARGRTAYPGGDVTSATIRHARGCGRPPRRYARAHG